MAADFDVRDNPDRTRFEVEVDGKLSIADYTITPNAILFRHTEVPPELEGRGIGKALVIAGLAAARERGLMVIPTCHFFAGYIQRHPETHNLVHPDYRRALGL